MKIFLLPTYINEENNSTKLDYNNNNNFILIYY